MYLHKCINKDHNILRYFSIKNIYIYIKNSQDFLAIKCCRKSVIMVKFNYLTSQFDIVCKGTL